MWEHSICMCCETTKHTVRTFLLFVFANNNKKKHQQLLRNIYRCMTLTRPLSCSAFVTTMNKGYHTCTNAHTRNSKYKLSVCI